MSSKNNAKTKNKEASGSKKSSESNGEFGKDNRKLHLDVLKLNQKNNSRTSPVIEENIRGSNSCENNDYNEKCKESNLELNEEELTEKLSQQKMMKSLLQSKIDVSSQSEEKIHDFNHININDRTVSNEKIKSPDILFDQKDKSEDKISHTIFNLQKDTVASPYKMLFIESKANMDTAVEAVEMGKQTTKVLDISTQNPILCSSSSQEAITSVTRRRMRRKAQSTIDDQAEHLTEMSVRGLDLFRYASINNGVYQCTECAKGNIQKTFKNKYSFQRHAFLYHEGKHRKVFPCNICGKEFSRPDKMKNHIKMTHESFLLKELEQGREINYLKSIVTKEGQTKAFKQRFQQENNVYQYCQEEITSMKKSNIDVPSANIDKHTLLGPSIISQPRTSESFLTIQHQKQN